jgi:hypothetical protein
VGSGVIVQTDRFFIVNIVLNFTQRDDQTTVTGMRPIILLDIDGVLNPVASPGRNGEDPKLTLPGARLALVRRLAACGRIAWVSTWPAHLAAGLESQLQLHDELLRVTLALRLSDEQEPTPKLRAVSRWLERMEAMEEADWDSVVWIDDVIGSDAQEWAKNYKLPVMLKKPAPAEGLTTAHVAAVEAFTRNRPGNPVVY